MRVDKGSLIHLHRNTYSVHSRLIGQEVEARLYADRVELWYAGKQIDTLPRLVGRDKHAISYRHIIDQLVRMGGTKTSILSRGRGERRHPSFREGVTL